MLSVLFTYKKLILGLLASLSLVFALYFTGGFHLVTSLLIPVTGEKVLLRTSLGNIEIKLYTKEVPNLTDNFIRLVEANKYDNTIFHRIVQDYFIQGGDYENHDGTGGHSFSQVPVDDEFVGLTHKRGTVSMANKGFPNTNGSQFFILLKDDDFFDEQHSIIGEVIIGMDIVDKISKIKVESNDFDGDIDKPLENIIIKKAILR